MTSKGLLVLPLVVGCASLSWTENARYTLDYASRAGQEADAAITEGYTEASKEADARHPDDDAAYAAELSSWDKAVAAIEAFHTALIKLEAILDSSDSVQARSFEGRAACVVDAIEALLEALMSVGLSVPAGLVDVLEVSEWLTGKCAA